MESIYPANQMAKPYTHCNPLFIGKNKLVGDTSRAHTKGSDILTPTPAISRASIFTSAPTLTSAPGSPGRYMDEDLQKQSS